MNIIWKYYFDSTIYNLGLSILIGAYAGFVWMLVVFGTIGTATGFLVYSYFKEQEYYFYYNYGYAKTVLMAKVWAINLLLVLVSLGIYTIIINLL